MSGLIAQGWKSIIADNGGFCCDQHRELYRSAYFAGAMNAICAVSIWEPGVQHIELKPLHLPMVCEELTGEYFKSELVAEAGGVRH